jgi:hypothetical protein
MSIVVFVSLNTVSSFLENLTNSEMLTMDDGELIDERIHVLTDNSTETYSVSIKTDDYLYPSNATRDETVFSETNICLYFYSDFCQLVIRRLIHYHY